MSTQTRDQEQGDRDSMIDDGMHGSTIVSSQSVSEERGFGMLMAEIITFAHVNRDSSGRKAPATDSASGPCTTEYTRLSLGQQWQAHLACKLANLQPCLRRTALWLTRSS